jgi:hypothetical protein
MKKEDANGALDEKLIHELLSEIRDLKSHLEEKVELKLTPIGFPGKR